MAIPLLLKLYFPIEIPSTRIQAASALNFELHKVTGSVSDRLEASVFRSKRIILHLNYESLPVAFGTETAKWECVGAIDITQLFVAGYLLAPGNLYYALALLALIIPQIVFQFKYFLKDPVKYDVKYQGLIHPKSKIISKQNI